MHPDIIQWRSAQRRELLARRSSIDKARHGSWNQRITGHLQSAFSFPATTVVAAYWPFKGEFDPRFVLRHWRDAGVRTALPVVLQKSAPMEFRQWWPGVATRKGVFDLPVPEGTPVLRPDALLIPPVGFDAMGYRLGYGAGYFDRTLAALSPQPLKIGVAFELSRMQTIRPQPHDIAMDFIVTEDGVRAVDAHGLTEPLPDDQVRQRVDTIVQGRFA